MLPVAQQFIVEDLSSVLNGTRGHETYMRMTQHLESQVSSWRLSRLRPGPGKLFPH